MCDVIALNWRWKRGYLVSLTAAGISQQSVLHSHDTDAKVAQFVEAGAIKIVRVGQIISIDERADRVKSVWFALLVVMVAADDDDRGDGIQTTKHLHCQRIGVRSEIRFVLKQVAGKNNDRRAPGDGAAIFNEIGKLGDLRVILVKAT